MSRACSPESRPDALVLDLAHVVQVGAHAQVQLLVVVLQEALVVVCTLEDLCVGLGWVVGGDWGWGGAEEGGESNDNGRRLRILAHVMAVQGHPATLQTPSASQTLGFYWKLGNAHHVWNDVMLEESSYFLRACKRALNNPDCCGAEQMDPLNELVA